MSSGIDIEYVQKTYERMTDDELIHVATQDAYGLTPEAMEVVKTEIKKRGLDENIAKGVEAQNKIHSIEEIDAYCDVLSKLSCPICGSATERLNGTMTGEVMSFVFFTWYKKKVKVGCPHCLDKANENALITTAVLGWWGFPWGLVRTPQAILLNIKSKRTNHAYEHNKYLRTFVLSIIGELETYKEDKERLSKIIARQNDLQL